MATSLAKFVRQPVVGGLKLYPQIWGQSGPLRGSSWQFRRAHL